MHFQEHIYLAQFKDDFILLDTRKDKYTICSNQSSELFIRIIEKRKPFSENGILTGRQLPVQNKVSSTSQFPLSALTKNHFSEEGDHLLASAQQCSFQKENHISQFSSQDLIVIQNLIEDRILEKKDTPYPFYIDLKPNSCGVSNVDWRLPLENKKVHLNFSVLRVFMTLLQVNFFIKFRGLHATIQLIKKSRKNHLNYIVPQDEELENLANLVNKACLIHPTRIKCLEWAITYVLLALKQKWKCNLEIGVQNYPFFAHAWVECAGKVVMDSQDLREGLSIILNEPFRMLSI